jgi:hypothetical protein
VVTEGQQDYGLGKTGRAGTALLNRMTSLVATPLMDRMSICRVDRQEASRGGYGYMAEQVMDVRSSAVADVAGIKSYKRYLSESPPVCRFLLGRPGGNPRLTVEARRTEDASR